ncbi:MAG: deoxyribodipyrimidine photo-lyase [Planctomycetes bacterium]|nr:deoxyribodipyrimidine photo-lyase [Planctomycetota bacterium]
MTSPSIVWLRQDLRLADNPALQAAIDRGGPVIPVFIRSTDEEGPWRPGEASDWWLHQSLQSFAEQLRHVGSRLIVRAGTSLTELLRLVDETKATAVYWNRRYEPAAIARDKTVKAELRRTGLLADSFNGQLLFEPWEICTQQGSPYQVFTAFWRTCLSKPAPAAPVQEPERILSPASWPDSVALESLHLEPTRPWVKGLRDAWQPGTTGARQQLATFLQEAVSDYSTARDFPARIGTSRLSPHLHFGEISPRTIWHAVHDILPSLSADGTVSAETYRKELGWREFAHHLLFHFPSTTDQPLRPEFANFPWDDNQSALRAWQRGQTGYPIVDAGMRELWATGWMHNRVRMIVASFLVKDLRLHWRHGAAWFWDTLVDADLAANTLGWQWSAGCGADAAPYFRVFNPSLQSAKFDQDGEYLRTWIPELNKLPTKWSHAPWTAPSQILLNAKVTLGKTYPNPIVDHAQARTLALQAFEHIKRA